MTNNDLQDHLNHAVYGTPQLKPDEQRKYLGTFRERVDLVLTFGQLSTPEYLTALAQETKLHPEYVLLVNAAIPNKILAKILKLAQDNHIQVTTTSNVSFGTQNDDSAIILAAKKQALNLEIIDIAKRYPLNNSSVTDTTQKSFWHRFFN